MKSIVGGNFFYADGLPVSNGAITFALSQDATGSSGGQFGAAPLTYRLTNIGNIIDGAIIVANDELTPSNTNYVVSVYNNTGCLVYGSAPYILSGNSPISLSNLYPTNIIQTAQPPGPATALMQLVNGSFIRPNGMPLSNGTIVFDIQQDQELLSGGHVSRLPVTFQLDVNGNIEPQAFIFASDGFLNSTSTYLVTVYDSNGVRVEGPDQYYVDTNSGTATTFDLSTAAAPNGSMIFQRQGGLVPVVQPTIVISPSAASIQTSQSTTFSSIITGVSNTPVVWDVDGIAGGNSAVGTISGTGVYVAPGTDGQHTITASLTAYSGVFGTAIVAVQSTPLVITMSVAPTLATIKIGSTQQFISTVTGTSATNVVWSVNGITGGSVGTNENPTSTNTTTANNITLTVNPPVVTSDSITITGSAKSSISSISNAALYMDGSHTATTTQNLPTTGVGVASNFTLQASNVSASQHSLVITITSATNQTCSLSMSVSVGVANVGTISPTGLYTATNTGTFSITATSQANPLVSASAGINVNLGIAVGLAPSNIAVVTNGTAQLTATVTGTSNTTVQWTVDGIVSGNGTVGTITSGGLYTAPNSIGTHTIVASPLADPTQAATATVNVVSPAAVSIAVSPSVATVLVNQSQQFTASITGTANQTATWQVNGVTGGNTANGRISTNGLYVAPNFTATLGGTATGSAIGPTTGLATTLTMLVPTVAPNGIGVSGTLSFPTTANNAANTSAAKDYISRLDVFLDGAVVYSNTNALASEPVGSIVKLANPVLPVNWPSGWTGSAITPIPIVVPALIPGTSHTVTTKVTLVETFQTTSSSYITNAVSSTGTQTVTFNFAPAITLYPGLQVTISSYSYYTSGGCFSSGSTTTLPGETVTITAVTAPNTFTAVFKNTHVVNTPISFNPSRSFSVQATQTISVDALPSVTVTAISNADNTKTDSSNVTVVTQGASTGIQLTSLITPNTSASLNYNQGNFPNNFGNLTCDTQTNATYPPNSVNGYAIDPTKVDMSLNPVTPGVVSDVDVHTLLKGLNVNLIQGRANSSNSSGQTTLNCNIATQSGSLLVALVRGIAANGANFTVTDNLHQQWVGVYRVYGPSSDHNIGMFYISNSPSITAVTANFPTPVTNPSLIVYEISGALNTGTVDSAAYSSTAISGNSLTSGAITTTNLTDLLLYGVDVDTAQNGSSYNGFSPASDFNFAIPIATQTYSALAFKTVASIQTNQSTSMSWGNSAASAGSIFLSFKSKHPYIRWFEVWTPWFQTGLGGGSSHIDVGVTNNSATWIQNRINDSINRGFDGCVIDWFGPVTGVNGYVDSVVLLLQQYLKSQPVLTNVGKPYTFTIMVDSAAYITTSQLISLLSYVSNQYLLDPNYETRTSVESKAGLPIVLFNGAANSNVGYPTAFSSIIPICAVFQGAATLNQSFADACFDSSHPYSSGPVASDPYNVNALNGFYTAIAASAKVGNYGAITSGFNGTLTKNVSWALGKYLPAGGGTCPITQASHIQSQLQTLFTCSRMLWVSANNWEEGTSMESGIENSAAINLTINNGVLNWTVTTVTGVAADGTTAQTAGTDESTIFSYDVYATLDGVNVTKLGSVAPGTHSFNLSSVSLVHGSTYTVNVIAVGQPCVRNHVSNSVTYTA